MDAIESVRQQDYDNWEIVIVDDCSTDNSKAIYQELKDDSRIRIFYNIVNEGVGYTKHRLVEEACGEICGFLDPDDALYGQDVLSTMVKEHLRYPKASCVYSDLWITDLNFNVVDGWKGEETHGISAIQTQSWPYKPFAAFKRSLYLMTGGIDPIMRNAEDQDLYYKLEEVGDMIHIDKVAYLYRMNPRSISTNGNEYKSRAWHTYACVQAMKRRGLSDERCMLFPVEHLYISAFRAGGDHVRQSRTYRLGTAILRPFKRLFKHKD